MATKYTTATAAAEITMDSSLQTLADDTAALSSAAIDNGATDTRYLSRDFSVSVGTQGSARASDAEVSLLIVPVVNSNASDTATLKTATHAIAKTEDGSLCTATLDAAVTARVINFSRVRIPNGAYYVGVLNETGQAFAGTNSVYAAGPYDYDDV